MSRILIGWLDVVGSQIVSVPVAGFIPVQVLDSINQIYNW